MRKNCDYPNCVRVSLNKCKHDNWTVYLLGFGDKVRTYVFRWIRGFCSAPLRFHYRVYEFVFQYQMSLFEIVLITTVIALEAEKSAKTECLDERV